MGGGGNKGICALDHVVRWMDKGSNRQVILVKGW